jgi:hypothetical protein
MPLQQLFVLAIASMVFLAVLRVVRVHFGRTPHPEGIAKLLFGLAFVVLPPIALVTLTDPGGGSGLLAGLAWVPLFAIMLVGLLIVMRVAGAVAAAVAPRPVRRILLLALAGSEGDLYDVPFNPPVTPRLAAIVALVDRTNAVFPRGMAFRDEIDRSGFRASWDALDTATCTLEEAMAEENQHGRGIPSTVAACAGDARSRLHTLRQFAVDAGQSWATA